ncbi:MAG: cation diffusion facilitator family transporter [Gammaproteobacteria bacterium]|nr:cation diffusion facilitator family transporter [Gammaproteobacteria bacterium]
MAHSHHPHSHSGHHVSGHGLQQDVNQGARYKDTLKVTLIGSVIDLLLGVAKIVVGFISHSQALIADGVHSLSDLATDFMVLYAAKHASAEADDEHPYGHGRIETIATVGLGIALIGVSIGIAIDSTRRLFEPDLLLQPGMWALIIAGASVVSKEAIYHYTMHAARKYNSDLLRANAWHSRSDAISSIVVIIGVVGTMAGLEYLDAIAAVIVAAMVAKIGWELAWTSIHELIDTGLDQDRVEAIHKVIKSTSGVRSLHMLRTRRMGGIALVDVHIQVEPSLSVSEGHQISETVRRSVIADIPEVADVTVHVDAEDDLNNAKTAKLPLRQEIIPRLGKYFTGIPAAGDIERITLHYMNGKVNAEIVLPINYASDEDEADALTQEFQDTIKDDPELGEIVLYFH